jgi:hypothetical protein
VLLLDAIGFVLRHGVNETAALPIAEKIDCRSALHQYKRGQGERVFSPTAFRRSCSISSLRCRSFKWRHATSPFSFKGKQVDRHYGAASK